MSFEKKLFLWGGGAIAFIILIGSLGWLKGVLSKESREGQRQVVALQYSDRSGEWYELEFPNHQIKRLIDLLIPFQMDIEQAKD